ncbi:hypothetical protein G1H11_19060 [Phytoactinopolyspora alkaliphila]|uniref:Carbohydrate kinase n=1 Tax=Phytoactinopolyspora alkaliphila TaxID=1783498 RepID=A0A6N9YQR5_9ACTN|nr:FGGY family carbohydrate kinase [Phytoactinopolyspora alkaliphila]NED97401.1 hypothetical protein [Phytoactinopolyspora alkaliphila]
MDVLLGLDVGTTNCKAMVMSVDGRCLGLGSVPTPWTRVATGAEAPAADLLDAVLGAASDALDQAGVTGRVLGVGVTGLAEAGVLLGRDGQPVAPVIAWYDTRGGEHAGELSAAMGARAFSSITGLKLTDRPSIFKYRWMVRDLGIGGMGTRWLSVPEWVAHALGADQLSEASLAGRTGMFDVIGGRHSAPMLEWAGAPPDLLADLAVAGEAFGYAGPDTGALAGAAITVAGHDHVAAGVGLGATGPGDLLDSCGTSEALIRTLRSGLTPDAVADAVDRGVSVGRHMFPDTWQIMTGIRSGLGLWRFLKLMRVTPDDLPRLDTEALTVEPGPASPVVEDIWTELATLRNIGYEPEPAQIWRAAVEAVQLRAVQVKDLLESMAGPTRRIVATGGGLNSEAVRVLKRRILGEFEMPDVPEAGARGAAVFAAVAAGVADRPEMLAPVA